MSSNAFFSDLLASISERGRTLLRRAGSSDTKRHASDLIELCEALLSGRGEASGTAMAREVLDHYHSLDEAGRLAFFETLTRDFGPDREKLADAIEAWCARVWPAAPRRLVPSARRFYAFSRPVLADAPLFCVEVALTESFPAAIAPLLAEDRQPVPVERARTAVFYSISNTQRGLGGISFGSFLIKQVVEELRREFPKLANFVTLSPVPGLMQWVRTA